MAKRIHFEKDSKIRHTLSVTNIDFIAYKEWKASAKREENIEKHFLWWSWMGWEKSGDPISFNIECQDDIGRPIQIPPTVSRKEGYFSSKCFAAFTAQPPEGETVSSISSMRMTYSFNNEDYELVTGRNWITYAIAIAVIIIAVVVIFPFFIV